MQEPSIVLDILNKKSNTNINHIYKYLYNEKLYLQFSNKQDNIKRIIKALKEEKYIWNHNKDNDKLLFKVIHFILNALYQSTFLDYNESYQKNNIALAIKKIDIKGTACEWFIQWKIDDYINIPYFTILDILQEKITDNRLIQLLRKMFKSKVYGIDYYNYESYSGTPINGNLSPLLFEIYLNKLDTFIENKLIPLYNQDKTRPLNDDYMYYAEQIHYKQRILKYKCSNKTSNEILQIKEDIKQLRKKIRQLPYKCNIEKCTFRRLSYIRHFNDCLIVFTGTYNETQIIKNQIEQFFKTILNIKDIQVNVHSSKSNIKPVRFLNYNIITQWNNNKLVKGQRSLHGQITFLIPNNIIMKVRQKYCTKNNKPKHLTERIYLNDFDMIKTFQSEYQGYCQYYKCTRNQQQLAYIKWILETSLVKTLAAKFKKACSKIYRKYHGIVTVNNFNYKVLKCIYKNNNETYITYFGGIPLKCDIRIQKIIDQKTSKIYTERSSFIKRISSKHCFFCNSNNNIQLHHINNLKNCKNDLDYIKRIKALKRKIIPLCKECHSKLHKGLL